MRHVVALKLLTKSRFPYGRMRSLKVSRTTCQGDAGQVVSCCEAQIGTTKATYARDESPHHSGADSSNMPRKSSQDPQPLTSRTLKTAPQQPHQKITQKQYIIKMNCRCRRNMYIHRYSVSRLNRQGPDPSCLPNQRHHEGAQKCKPHGSKNISPREPDAI